MRFLLVAVFGLLVLLPARGQYTDLAFNAFFPGQSSLAAEIRKLPEREQGLCAGAGLLWFPGDQGLLEARVFLPVMRKTAHLGLAVTHFKLGAYSESRSEIGYSRCFATNFSAGLCVSILRSSIQAYEHNTRFTYTTNLVWKDRYFKAYGSAAYFRTRSEEWGNSFLLAIEYKLTASVKSSLGFSYHSHWGSLLNASVYYSREKSGLGAGVDSKGGMSVFYRRRGGNWEVELSLAYRRFFGMVPQSTVRYAH